MTETTYQSLEEVNKQHRVSVHGVLKYLGVSKSGYYAWKNRKPSRQQLRKKELQKEIRQIYEANHQIYGAPKIHRKLQEKGLCISERTVTRYMKEMGIKACYIKPYTTTTRSEDFSMKLENILKEEFHQQAPNTVWCTDITYIYTHEGFVYLSCIMDLFSRKIVGWKLSRDLSTDAVVAAVKEAICRRQGVKPEMVHTDRGVQYTSEAYEKATEGIQRSYSKKAYPWDNACIESFHALIKREWLNRFSIKNYEQAYRLVFEYIETFYNTRRIHSHCGYLSPDLYEKAYADQIRRNIA